MRKMVVFNRQIRIRLCFLAAGLHILGMPTVGSALAEKTGGVTQDDLDRLPTGDQQIVENYSGRLNFAGHDIHLQDFSGVMGYSTEIAYIATISGSAQLDDLFARRGRMLLIPPFGQDVMSERFDAERLHNGWVKNDKPLPKTLAVSLDDLAKAQKRGIFLGRLGRTGLNVAVSGAAASELDRRANIGGKAVREVRFEKSETPEQTERQIIRKFVQALAEKDAEAASQFMDPLPYGDMDLRGPGGVARLLMAQTIIDERDWRPWANDAQIDRDKAQSNRWIITAGGNRMIITLRTTVDFAFVHSIRAEG